MRVRFRPGHAVMLLGVAVLASPAAADPVKILVWHPLRGGTDNHPDYNPLIRSAIETGVGGPIEFVETMQLSAGDFAEVDLAYLWTTFADSQLISPLSPFEQSSLEQWNADGGSAFLAFEHSTLGESFLGAAFGLHSGGFSFNWQLASVTPALNFLTDGPHGQPESFWTFNSGWFDSAPVSGHWVETAWLDWNGEAVQGYYDWHAFSPGSGVIAANADTSLLDDAGGDFTLPLREVLSNFFAYVMEGPPDAIPGDVNRDGTVDGQDLFVLMSQWGACPAPPSGCAGDLDGDGAVGFGDLALLILYWS